jgi:hypothetical protein
MQKTIVEQGRYNKDDVLFRSIGVLVWVILILNIRACFEMVLLDASPEFRASNLHFPHHFINLF